MPKADETLDGLDLQRSLEELRGVRGARVEAQGDEVIAVRVLVVPERGTQETVSDVRAVAATLFDLEIDPARIEVLRVAEPLAVEGGRRRKLSGIAIERSADRFHARVVLELGGDVLVGESDSPTEQGFEFRSVARATLEGLRELLNSKIDLDSVQVLPIGNGRLAVVTLARGGQTLVGTALVRLDEHDAIARATLDAVNRTISSPKEQPKAMRLVR
jgi:hypothetical protein